jgi:hypothetical protein
MSMSSGSRAAGIVGVVTFLLVSLQTPRSQAQSTPAATSYTVSFMTSQEFYLTAEYGGGTRVQANRKKIGPWEKFTLIDENGGQLLRGDKISIVSSGSPQDNQQPQKLQAQNGGADYVYANYPHAGVREEWTRFTLLKQAEGDAINSFDRVFLQTSNGHLVDVLHGGPADNVAANGTNIRAASAFTIIIY